MRRWWTRIPAGYGQDAPGYPRGGNTAVSTTVPARRCAPRMQVPAQQGQVAHRRRIPLDENR